MVSGTFPRRVLRYAFTASFSLLSLAAQAQERDPAAAQALFDQARELSQPGQVRGSLSQTYKRAIDSTGIGTQFHLADCYEQSGRIASAWAQFLDVASQARATSQPDREKAATKRAEKLEPRLPRLLLSVPRGQQNSGPRNPPQRHPRRLRAMGCPAARRSWRGRAHRQRPRQTDSFSQTLRVEEGKTASDNVPALAPGDVAATPPRAAPAVPGPATPASTPLAATPAPSAPREAPAAKSSGNTPLILALAGVGVVGLGVGTVFALTAKSKYNESKGLCDLDDANSCSAPGVEMRNDARGQGNIATVGFIAGGAALAGAGIVWLFTGNGALRPQTASSPARLRATPAVAPNLAALFVQGSF